MWFGGGRRDGGNGGGNLRLWKGGGQDVLSCNVLLRIVPKVLVDKGVLGGCGKEVLFLIFTILGFVEGDVGKGVEAVDRGGRDRGTGNNVLGAVGDIKEREVLNVVKSGPVDSRGWGILEFGGWGMWDNGLEDVGSDIERTWVVPGIVRALEDLKDGGSGIRNVLLIDVVKGGPGSDGDMGEGRGGDDGGLGGSEGHFTYTVSSTLETVLMSRPTTVIRVARQRRCT